MIRIRAQNIPVYIFLAIAFLLGGPMQLLGALSPTKSNYLALACCLVYLVSRPNFKVTASEGLLLGGMVAVLLSPFLNGSSWAGALVYVYYLLCPLIAARTARIYFSKNEQSIHENLTKTLIAMLALQALAVMFQNAFADQLISIASSDISRTDITSGTFYTKSDGSLAIFCTISCVLITAQKVSLRWKLAAVVLSGAAIYMSGSKAAQAYFPIAVAATALHQSLSSSRWRRAFYAMGALLLAIVAVVVSVKAGELYTAFMANLYETYDYRYGDNQAQRFAPLGDMIFSPLSYAGHGALTYYNPLTGNWLYYSGFSLIYSLYYDYGLIGVLLSFLYATILFKETTASWPATLLGVAGFAAFSLTAFSFTDLAFFFFITFACAYSRRHAELSAVRTSSGVD